MFCTHCGAELEDGTKFCPVCGQDLRGRTAETEQSDEKSQAAEQEAPAEPAMEPRVVSTPAPLSQRKPPSASVLIIGSCVATCLVLVVILVVTGVFSPPSASSPETAETEANTSQVEDAQGQTVTALKRASLITPLDLSMATYAAPALSSYVDQDTLKANVEEAQGASESTGSSSSSGSGTSVATDTKKNDDPSSTANPYGTVPDYTVASDFSNVSNFDDVYVPDNARTLLAQNGFVVVEGAGGYEYFDLYEMNRYSQTPSFVTTDSIMHTYHLYFSNLLKKTEKNELSGRVSSMSSALLAESESQLNDLEGTEWESAAQRNVVFFAVACKLMGQDAQVPDDLASTLDTEVSNIMSAQGAADSPLMGGQMDYSQFKPRGYYEGDETLEAYFRTMMWYGQAHFTQSDEDLDRSAALMTLAINKSALADWSAVYSVTGFFAGQSDDCGYYEYYPVLTAAYGDDVSTSSLPGNDDAWNDYHSMTEKMRAPKVSSSIVAGSDNSLDEQKGFRLMGQRFSIDEGIFTQLIYDQVGENSSGETRMLPDPLDVPAALGSEEALSILDSEGATSYAGYSDNMNTLRQEIANNGGTIWTESLYSQWLYTLNPLLVSKGEGYPSFMRSSSWNRKNLQTYLASYTELKHDTVLYSKQVMAEMGAETEPVDDRGYVEPEPEVYARLANLTRATSNGLQGYGMLDSDSASQLELLAQLCDQLQTISEKELSNESLSDEEYELIRSYGGQLEHFWAEAYDNDTEESANRSMSHPAALVTDIANDGSGTCLEVATGRVSKIYVVYPIDGELHVGVGAVSSYYQFEQPVSDRLTDSEWRAMLGITSDGSTTSTSSMPSAPEWTSSFQVSQ